MERPEVDAQTQKISQLWSKGEQVKSRRLYAGHA